MTGGGGIELSSRMYCICRHTLRSCLCMSNNIIYGLNVLLKLGGLVYVTHFVFITQLHIVYLIKFPPANYVVIFIHLFNEWKTLCFQMHLDRRHHHHEHHKHHERHQSVSVHSCRVMMNDSLTLSILFR